ncbi:heterokaryon incompatibility protein-domain-containing protein [Gymnopilus junonius]|uniref:Heterokaryon incompatibility protein-domain-containing protein n=1 Tax=Gymnopilus junonius TaxID=109634 RepID=A0A9P5NXY6_GYMJU|nr:heterokaryon incompatibility protein-domain-containing protein [Gymnopilus junonius]
MKLCDLCRLIPIEKPPSLPKTYLDNGPQTQGGDLLFIEYRNENNPPPQGFGYPHYPSESQLKESAKTCDLCRLIYDEFTRIITKMPWPSRDDGFFITARETNQQGFLVWIFGEKGNIRRVGAFGAGVRNGAGSLSSIFRGHPIHKDSSDQTASNIVKQWVQHCTQHHTLCGPPEGLNAPLPSRVIDVGTSPGEAKLIETHGTMKGYYTSLSYSWGIPPHSYKLTRSNLSTYKSAIKFSDEIPRTIVDAIDLTRLLGIRYIWVDALCIMQDSDTDWGNESAKMLNYYGNAYLTISAAASDSSYKGIFNKRDTPPTTVFHLYPKADQKAFLPFPR